MNYRFAFFLDFLLSFMFWLTLIWVVKSLLF